MAGGIPSGAVGVSIAVLLYSGLCLTLSILLVCLLWSYGERWTYVTLLALFTCLSTLASMAQQIHFATAWEVIKQAQFDQAVASLHDPSLRFGGAAQIVDIWLFWIQFYSYNVMSLMVFFWTVALFQASWGVQATWLGEWQLRMDYISKVFGVLFPAFVVGLANVHAIKNIPPLFFMIMNLLLFFDLTAGSVLLALILFKYVKTRRLTARNAERSPWWASHQKSTGSNSEGTMATNATSTTGGSEYVSTRHSTYDRALVTRFTIGFVILAFFEGAIIFFTIFQSITNRNIAFSGKPDLSLSSTIVEIVLFMPGVTASLVTFLVFGTTKSWRQYWVMIAGGCGARVKLQERSLRRRTNYPPTRAQAIHLDEFERLPSHTAQDNVPKGGFVLPPLKSLDSQGRPSTPNNARQSTIYESSDDEGNRLPIQTPEPLTSQPQFPGRLPV